MYVLARWPEELDRLSPGQPSAMSSCRSELWPRCPYSEWMKSYMGNRERERERGYTEMHTQQCNTRETPWCVSCIPGRSVKHFGQILRWETCLDVDPSSSLQMLVSKSIRVSIRDRGQIWRLQRNWRDL